MPSMGELFGLPSPSNSSDSPPRPSSQAATSSEGLANRLALFNGLPEGERKAVAQNLGFLYVPNVGSAEQELALKRLYLLHNGYRLGGARATDFDCSSFATQILPADVRKGRLTTMDLRSIWVYLRYGHLPSDVKIPLPRRTTLIRSADGFAALDLYSGDRPAPGDFLVYRIPWEPIGHVFLVKDYSPETGTAQVMEAAQSAGTIRERPFRLTHDAYDREPRRLRPGLMILRVKPTSNRACKYREDSV